MSRQMLKSPVWHGDSCLGEAEVFPTRSHQRFQFPNNEIRIARFSPRSERCPPLSILHTISPFSVLCKVQSLSATDHSPIYRLYLSCFQELKTAIVLSGDEELHLVAMPTKVDRPPCFWCCSVPSGLYNSCLGMLNLRCLAIVFDLDETLIVANTMKSFEDRIEALSRRIDSEDDPVRVSGMSAELKRYLEDKAFLKQYTENDNVMDNGKLIAVQNEEIPPPSAGSETVVRPVIRLQDKNIVLTRINPEIRDTSVLVRLRPAWEDLRCYLTAKGRKRFEVYVCTMAERDYALEMWRLLDPDAHLISSKQLLDRVVCVKSGLRKSLLNVFQGANCHPKLAMVIDDRSKVWDDKDQPRVHVVPAFTPYYAPQAEVLFSGEKIGAGVGRTWKEAQHQAADNALRHLANNYVAFMTLGMGAVDRDLDKLSLRNENGFLREFVDSGSNELPKREESPNASTSEPSGIADDSRNLSAIIAEIKELCMTEGFNVVFQDQPPISLTLKQGEYYAQVEIAGQVVGKGIGLSKEGAKLQAAEEVLRSLKASENQQAQKNSNLSRPSLAVPTKRFKDETSWGFNGLPSSRLHKNGH